MTERIKTYDEMTVAELREHLEECRRYERDYRAGATAAENALNERAKAEAKALVESLDPAVAQALARQLRER